MTTLADLNRLWPADHNATPWVATPDGSWTRMAGAGVNPNMLAPPKEGAPSDCADSIASRAHVGSSGIAHRGPPSNLSITLSDGLRECSGAV
jgi:hypothetical protein